jgi:hypothetical protein
MRTVTARTRSRSRPGHGHGHGLTTDTSAGMARTWSRTGCGRGLDKATAIMPVYGADILRPNRDHFADAETLAS